MKHAVARTPRSWTAMNVGVLALWAGAVIFGALLQHRRWQSAVEHGTRLQEDVGRLERELTEARKARQAFTAVLRNFPTGPTFMTGRTVGTGGPFAEQRPGTALVYVIDPDCAACRLNYDSLATLAAAFPGAVRIVTFNIDSVRLADYAQTERLPTSILQVTDGQLQKLTPRHGFPLTLLFDHDSLQSITDGRLKQEDLAEIRRILAAR